MFKKGYKMSAEHKKKIGLANAKSLIGHTPWNKGLKGSIPANQTSFKLGHQAPNKGKRILKISNENHWNWKGGITAISRGIRASFEYEEWRKSVFERDNYTCQGCKIVGGWLEADHIKPFSLFPSLRLNISNGRTLCKPCHKKLGWNFFKENNPRKQTRIGEIT